MSFFDTLTWTCHVCGDERPDRAIAVHSRSHGTGFCDCHKGYKFMENLRYCNDRAECVEGVKSISLFRKART